ncbi:MAG: hypothetical protein KJ061_05740, partial [Vicinamibacteraceae bacterium]|nr:hypothetical protein [Vicinamibacteraceae bacterium]
AVSAFNNAGFSLFPDNLVRFRSDVVVSLTIAALIVVGGLGFLVLSELARVRRWRPLSLHAKLALSLTGALLVGGTLLVWLLERGNAATIGLLPYPQQFVAAFFQSVSTRTAGFNTLDVPSMTVPTLFLMMVLMFVGAAPGGTGGGVKVTTFGVTVLALLATVRGREEPVAFSRRIPADIVTRAFFICLIGFLAINVVAGTLLVLERGGLLATLFETTSAFGTVGLSIGMPGETVSYSGSFDRIGKLLVAVMMFTGRVGPLTLAIALAGRRPVARVKPAPGRVLIG